jgi:hypothetical protein
MAFQTTTQQASRCPLSAQYVLKTESGRQQSSSLPMLLSPLRCKKESALPGARNAD